MNGIDITVVPHDQAVALLTGIRGEISLVVARDENDATPLQTTNHSSTVTWPTTPLDAELPIIVQPPTPNYAPVQLPQPSAVVKDAADVATDSSDVENGAAAGVSEPTDTVETDAEVLDPILDPIPTDLIDLSAAPPCDDVVIVPQTVTEIDVQQRTTELMCFGQFGDAELDFYDDDDDYNDDDTAAVSAVLWSPMSSHIRDMIQHRMLETLRLL